MLVRIAVRQFRLRDLDRVMEMERAAFGADAYDRNLFAEFFDKCGKLFLVAERRGRVCGYIVTCVRAPQPAKGGEARVPVRERAELVSVTVDPAQRRHGVGSALLKSTLGRLRRLGVHRLGLMVRLTNTSARSFYEGFGFRRLRTVPQYYEDGEDGLLMSKDLASPKAKLG